MAKTRLKCVLSILESEFRMKKVIRDGMDPHIAFLSGMKHLVITSQLNKPCDEKKNTASIYDEQHRFEHNSAIMTLLQVFRGYLRKIVRFFYISLKPLIRPLAIRIRRFLIEELRQEVLANKGEVLHELKSSLHELKSSLHELKSSLHELQVSNRSMNQDFIQDQQALRKLLFPHLNRIEEYSCSTARRIAISSNSGEVLVKTEVGFVLCAANDYALLACLIDTGELEPGTRLLIQKFLNPGETFIDIGANIGMHTLAAARTMKGKGSIIAFEPYEPTKKMLEKSIWMNGFSNMVEIHQAAVSNSVGQQTLYLGKTSGHHSLFSLTENKNAEQQSVKVPLLRLDDVISLDQKIDLIKIDAEGAEIDVIESAASLISNNPDLGLIAEFGSAHLLRTGKTAQQWMKTFYKMGLQYRVINNDSGVLEDLTLDELMKVESKNLFFAKKNSHAWDRVNC